MKINKLNVIVSIFFIVLFFYVLIRDVDINKVININLNISLFLLSMLLFYFSFLIRSYRFNKYLSIFKRIKLKDSLKIYLFTWFLNGLLPSKLGEVYRISSGKKFDISKSKMSSIVFFERFFDLLVILILTLFLFVILGFKDKNIFLSIIFGFILLALVLIFIFISVKKTNYLIKIINIIPFGFKSKLILFLNEFKDSLHYFKHKLHFFIIITCFGWFVDTAGAYVLLTSLGFNLNFLVVGFLDLSAALISGIPLTPGGVGTVELFMKSFLVGLGLSSEAGLYYALLYRFIMITYLFYGVLILIVGKPFSYLNKKR